MKNIYFFSLITICVLCCSCKKDNASQIKIVNETKEIQVEKKYPIPSDLTIEKKEEIDIDGDDTREVIITASDSDLNYTYEFWFKSNKLIYQFKYPWGEINKKWLVNLDNDGLKEIIRMHGYSEDLDCAIYDIVNNKQNPVLYFNPILEDIRYPNKYMWAYPNDIKDLILKENNKLQISLNNYQLENSERPLPDNQKELPFLFFDGKTSQPDMSIAKINKPEIMSLQSVINKVKGSLNSNKNDDLGLLVDDFSITGTWKSDCSKENETKILMFDGNEGDFYMKDSIGGLIAKITVKYNPETASFEYFRSQIIDTKYKYFDWNIDIKQNSPIAAIKKGDNRKIYLEWKGFYNTKTKKIEFLKNPFNQTSNTVILYNCDY